MRYVAGIFLCVLWIHKAFAFGMFGSGNSASYNATLQSLDLSSNNVGDMGAMAFSGLLFSAQGLKSLSLADNNISIMGAGPILQALKKQPPLNKVDLSKNPIGSQGSMMGAGIPGITLEGLIWIFKVWLIG